MDKHKFKSKVDESIFLAIFSHCEVAEDVLSSALGSSQACPRCRREFDVTTLRPKPSRERTDAEGTRTAGSSDTIRAIDEGTFIDEGGKLARASRAPSSIEFDPFDFPAVAIDQEEAKISAMTDSLATTVSPQRGKVLTPATKLLL